MQEAPSSWTVDLSGPRTIRSTDQTRSLLLEALCAHPAISLDCSAVTEADLSFVQLLISAQASAELAGKPLTLASAPSGAVLEALSKAGFAIAPGPLPGGGSDWLRKEGEDA